jgi:hypothetical protein
MLEDSVESFIAKWRRYAAPVCLFSRVEGDPLLECELHGHIFYVFERTNPYSSPVGKTSMIVHPVTDHFEITASGDAYLEVLGPSRLRIAGRVSEVRDRICVLDIGVPVVAGLLNAAGPVPAEGDFVSFEALPPVHGFVVHDMRPSLVAADGI